MTNCLHIVSNPCLFFFQAPLETRYLSQNLGSKDVSKMSGSGWCTMVSVLKVYVGGKLDANQYVGVEWIHELLGLSCLLTIDCFNSIKTTFTGILYYLM